MAQRVLLALIGCAMSLACGAETAPEPVKPRQRPRAQEPAPSVSNHPAFCARDGADAVRDLFCEQSEQPVIRSLADLQDVLDVSPRPDESDAAYVGNLLGRQTTTVLGHSTALSGRLVSPINPRTITIGALTILTFQRGVQRVELATAARGGPAFNFYLVSFEQACNAGEDGCGPGDLFTPRVESDWTRFLIQDDEELKNTPLDCRQCHQRGRSQPALLMRELESPWTHFFFPADVVSPVPGVSNSDLMRDYLAAKGDEAYGGYAVDTVSAIAPFVLQTTVGQQPLLFDAPGIENERHPYGAGGYTREPQPSPTWEGAYEAFKRGEQLALPYLEQRATDAQKQAELTAAYQRYRAGELDEHELPDLSDIFPDDPALQARIGLATEPDASPVDALIQACASCHNDVLDQDISRARFNVDLARLSRAELDRAIDRIQRPRGAPGAMPPPEARQLAASTREGLLEYLRRDRRDADPRLTRAAELGMAGR